MMNTNFISSLWEHLQEAEDGMGDGVGWLGGRWGVTLYFLSIVEFSCAGCIRRRGGLPRSFKRDGNSRIFRMDCWRYKLKRNFNLLNRKNLKFKTEVNELLYFSAPLEFSNRMRWIHPTSWALYTTIVSLQRLNIQKGPPFTLSHIFSSFNLVRDVWRHSLKSIVHMVKPKH